MEYQGRALVIRQRDDGFTELVFDLQGESVNKLSLWVLEELREGVQALAGAEEVRGLLIKSAKPAFIVGADITEFGRFFAEAEGDIRDGISDIHRIFNALEDLPVPTVCLVNGLALGGGLELALSCDFRVLDEVARIGLPETQLGIIPGWGGTVRLSRLIGADNALEWIAGGRQHKAPAALAVGAADAVVSTDSLERAGVHLLQQALDGKFDWRARRAEKQAPLQLNRTESTLAFQAALGLVAAQAGPHYPAPLTAVQAVQQHAALGRDEAQQVEAAAFAKMAKTLVAANLVGMFLGDQKLGKIAKHHAARAQPVTRAAVLGAGIMGGGIAYQSASTGTPIIMKDINPAGLELGLKEAGKLLGKRVKRGKLTPEQMALTLGAITPALSYGEFGSVDLVVEAVVENPGIKHGVLAEVEQHIGADTILTSNTSTISIDHLAGALQRPQNFCGMHFFNPVHAMPLVEVIRGSQTSDAAVAKTVNYALAMGKKPVVVRDCPGFLVNRILFPYLGAFQQLLREGADFTAVDRAMERFGWPMGPAYLSDVVGIDTAVHAAGVMAEGFPQRMSPNFTPANQVLLDNERLGQKNGLGYYRYQLDKRGKPKKVRDESVDQLLAPHCDARREFAPQEIVARMMTALCLEAVRCLEEKIVDSATELDLALVYGIGLPPFIGGALRYIDSLGVDVFVQQADGLARLGEAYRVTDTLRTMATRGERFYG